MLERLAVGNWSESLPSVTDALQWQSKIDSGRLARQTGRSEQEINAALAILGARGLAGYDVASGGYFHRVLPFDLDKVESLQPRLKSARPLIDNVTILSQEGPEVDAQVPGSDVTHFVRLRLAGNRCTCTWYARHQGARGPCKHILATRMRVEGTESIRVEETESTDSGNPDDSPRNTRN